MNQTSEIIHLEGTQLKITGRVTHDSVPLIQRQLKALKKAEIKTLDLAGVETVDSAGVAFLENPRGKGFEAIELINVPAEIQSAMDTFSSTTHKLPDEPHEAGFFEVVGGRVYTLRHTLGELVLLISEVTFWSAWGLFSRGGRRKGAILQQILLIGSNAVGIIALLSLVLGLILALQSAAQLRQFGASIYVADLIAISMVREMGPMMTAIIIAGRSGSSFAAEISSMKVSEELDALKMMAVNPIRYVVVPKFLAISISMPLLVIMSMILGIIGGLIVGVTYLDLTPESYITETLSILTLEDLLVGLSKSVFFAGVIVIIGSYYGFKAEGGAEGVGRVTTSAVVASIFAVIILDAIFSLIYMI